MQNVRLELSGPQGTFSTPGIIGPVIGKSGNVRTDGSLELGKIITSVTSIGRDDPTTAEAQRSATILRILQGTEKLDKSPWIQNIWLPNDHGLLVWPKEWSEKPNLNLPRPSTVQKSPSAHKLNPSQQKAVNYMLSANDDNRIILIQGPPGTGKTSVIAEFVQRYILRPNKGLWLVAQSNPAVKNIAEKLMSIGFLNWRLLLSEDFHLGWYEKNSIFIISNFEYLLGMNIYTIRSLRTILSVPIHSIFVQVQASSRIVRSFSAP